MRKLLTTLILTLIVSVGLAQELQIISYSASKAVLENGEWSTSQPAQFITYTRITPTSIIIKNNSGETLLNLELTQIKSEEYETHTTYVWESRSGDVVLLALFKKGYGSNLGKLWVSSGNAGIILEVDEGRFVESRSKAEIVNKI